MPSIPPVSSCQLTLVRSPQTTSYTHTDLDLDLYMTEMIESFFWTNPNIIRKPENFRIRIRILFEILKKI